MVRVESADVPLVALVVVSTWLVVTVAIRAVLCLLFLGLLLLAPGSGSCLVTLLAAVDGGFDCLVSVVFVFVDEGRLH